MKITFGLNLDGEHGWHPANRLGEPVVGPMGMLSLLETPLGLLRAEVTHAERIVQYRECLKRCDRSDRFFHASFGVDPLGTASMLLSWRDTWRLHGWNGEAASGTSARLKDMAAVEAQVHRVLAPSVGERLAGIDEALAKAACRIERIELADSLAAFPKRWRDVLARLPVQSMRDYPPRAAAGSVLGKLQAALASAHTGKEPVARLRWRDDGSVRIVRAETTLAAARWVAHLLHSQPGDIALIAEHERALLDTTLDATDVARQGFAEPSPLTPALQVLPLALATVWEPLDVYALLQFLSHPISPIPGYARWPLAELVADCPGIGGPRWLEALRKIEQRHPDAAAQIREAVAFWVEHPRYRPDEGAPLAALAERTRRVCDFFGMRLADPDPIRSRSSAGGYAQAVAVAAALETMRAQGESTIAPPALGALVSRCTGQGAPHVALDAQAGRVASVSHPGALIEPFERVIWWQFAAPVMPRRYPWTRSEIAALARCGVDLPDLSEVLARQGVEWLRPILNARKELVLVLPPPGEEVHPLWQEIQWFIENARPEALEASMGNARAAGFAEVAHRPLPQRRRWWQLPADTRVAHRERESYSSLDAFINSPYQWVLKYVARLDPSRLLAITDRNRLYGNLAHRLIDRFFRGDAARQLRASALQAWLSRELERVIVDEGAVLLMHGRRADYERLRSSLARTLAELQRQFAQASVIRVESERKLSGAFVGGALEGTADLIVHTAADARAIVDMKWSGSEYQRKRLAANRHLQLAIYAEMLRQETGEWPRVAYFVLEAASLLAPDTTFFPEARAVEGRIEVSTPLLWQQVEKAWTWRRAQIDAGMIEVALEGIDATEASHAPKDAFQPETLSPEFNDYRWLAGWEG
ncbi:MAG: PD-(D/E)XK nuclease family protein [Burkholderiales bacterium]|nr:PD-(D/E)XK nuclease family protein [Burkholderiales bacterium]